VEKFSIEIRRVLSGFLLSVKISTSFVLSLWWFRWSQKPGGCHWGCEEIIHNFGS